jgi:hypothetical protein
MLPGLRLHRGQQHCEESRRRGVGFYLHAKLSRLQHEQVQQLLAGVAPEDVLFNDETDISAVLRFLCRHEVIVTSSYHGVLWATYMDIPVYSVFDFSEKFAHLPFSLKKYLMSDGGGRPVLSRDPYVNGSLLREQCVRANEEFYAAYVEPFVAVLKTHAVAPPLIVARDTARAAAGGWMQLSDFDLRQVATTVRADCSPLNRNHVYDQLAAPQYETNLHVELDTRLGHT